MSANGRRLAKETLAVVLLLAAIKTAAPYGLGLAVSALIEGKKDASVTGMGVFLAITLLGYLVSFFNIRVRERLFQDNFWHIPMQLTARYFARPLGMLTSEDSEIDGGGVESMRDKVWSVIVTYNYNILPNYSLALFSVLVVAYVHPLLAVLALAYIVVDLLIGQKQNDYMLEKMKIIDTMFRRWDRRIREWWGAVQLIKFNGGEKKVIRLVKEDVQPALVLDDALCRVFVPWALLGRRMIGLVFIAGIYLVIGHFVLEGQVTGAAAVWCLFAIQQISTVLEDITEQNRELNKNLTRINKYREVLQKPVPFQYGEGKEFSDSAIGISFEQVSLTLGEGGEERQILRDVSFTIKPGERVGIVGPSGAGKSQLINLITRGMDPQKGTVRINEHDLRDLSLMSFLRFCGIIPQKSPLFEDSVRGNVMFGVSDHDWPSVASDRRLDERVTAALTKAGMEFGDRLTQGLDTQVGYQGMKLSGGQQSRVRIADAHFKLASHIADRPRLVIADEPTAALDSLSEQAVLEHLTTTLRSDTSLIMIAHRISTLVDMDSYMLVKPAATLAPGESQVVKYPSLAAMYEAEPLFRELADAQHFRP